MGVPLTTLAERLGLDISADAIIIGARFVQESGDPLRKGILYLQNTEMGCEMMWVDGPGKEIRAISQTGTATQWFNRISDQLEQFTQWELQLREFLLTRRLNEAMTLLSEVFGNAVYMVDSGFRVLAIDTNEIYAEISAIWKHLVTYGFIPYHILHGLRSSGEMEVIRVQKSASLFYSKWFNNKFINRCLYQDGLLWGHLFVVGYGKGFTAGDLAYAQMVGYLLEEILPSFSAPFFSRNIDHETFFLNVIDGSMTDRDQISKQLHPLKWDPDGKYRVLSLMAEVNIEMLAPLLCDKLEEHFNCRCVIWEEQVLAVFPIENINSEKVLEDRLRAFVSQEVLIGGLSDVFDGFYRLADNCQQSICALKMGNHLPRNLTLYSDIALSHLFSSLNPAFSISMFCDKAVFRLQDYDTANQSEYLRTLEVYLRNERKLIDTAAELYIHRNTLIYRIERIEKLTNLNLDDPDVRERVLLSCRMLREKSNGHSHLYRIPVE